MADWLVTMVSPSTDSGVAVLSVKQKMLNTYGLPEFILSNNGTHFSASCVTDSARKAGFECKFVSAYNPRGNIRVERMVGTFKTALQKKCAEN